MSNITYLLSQQVIVMFLLMIVGFILFKVKMVTSEGVKQLSSIALYVATPAAIINSFLQPFDYGRLKLAGWTMLLAMLTTIIGYIYAKVILKKHITSLGAFGVMFSNVGFMGIPVIQAVLGDEYVFFMAMVVAWMTLMTFTLGVWLMTGDTKSISLKKILKNPSILSIVIGLLIYIAQLSMPTPVVRVVGYLNNLNAPVAMIVLGCYMAEADMKSVIKSKETYLTIFGRLILVPLVMLLVLRSLPASFNEIKAVSLIAATTPIATALGMLSQQYGRNYSYGAGIVTLSTILSLVTMPLFLQFLS